MRFLFFNIFIGCFFVISCNSERENTSMPKISKRTFVFFTNDSIWAKELFISANIYGEDSVFFVKNLKYDSSFEAYTKEICFYSKSDSFLIKNFDGRFSYDTLIVSNKDSFLIDTKNITNKRLSGDAFIKKIKQTSIIELKVYYSGCFYHKNYTINYNTKTDSIKVTQGEYDDIDTVFYKINPELKFKVLSAIKRQEKHIIKNKDEKVKKTNFLTLDNCYSLSTSQISIVLKSNHGIYSLDKTIYCNYKELIELEKTISLICNHPSFFED